ncbi:MAG TPA: LPS export ABC transporter periplasmic protein LptC [Steroidobacteraceae bacterium]|nr:LPS export ABC transporter periplasmic protein LptC [Steroidobacteraceae bacterium]
MKRIVLPLLLLVTIAVAVWFRAGDTGPETAEAPGTDAEFDFEAQGVVMRQMGADGRLQYEVVANRIVQLPDGGPVRASGLTLRHDPPGTAEGSENRWVVTAAEAELPAQGEILTLSGQVRAQGIPRGQNTPLELATEEITFNLSSQELYAKGDVEVNRGRNIIRGRGRELRANATTGELKVRYILDATLPL